MERRELIQMLITGVSGAFAGLGARPTLRYINRKDFFGQNMNNPDNNRTKTEEDNTPDEENSDEILGYLSDGTISNLQSGGYLVYFRHGGTQSGRDQQKAFENISRPDELPEWDFNDCSFQRNLTIEALRNASEVGNKLEELDIEFSDVYSSPWCRAYKMADAMFGRYEVRPDLDYSASDNSGAVKDILDSVGDENIAVVAHTPGSMEFDDLVDGTEFSNPDEGQALVLDASKDFEESVIDGPESS